MMCPHCTNADETMMEWIKKIGHKITWLCGVCCREFDTWDES